MGISMGSGSGPQSEMNVVPLIDILLVLIIIFMVISPITPKGLNAEIPQPDAKPQEQTEPAPETVVLSITANGDLSINRRPTDWDRLGSDLTEIFKARATRVAFVWGAPELEFREVARAIGIMRDAGIDRVGLLPASFGAMVQTVR